MMAEKILGKANTRDISVKMCTQASATWKDAGFEAKNVARKAAIATWLAAGPKGLVELSLVLGDDAFSRHLNCHYRGIDSPTNVLAFSMNNEIDILSTESHTLVGDVVIALETLLREASAQGKLPIQHLSHLVVHGVLHLAGFEHSESTAAEEMEQLEAAILGSLGFDDPYRTQG